MILPRPVIEPLRWWMGVWHSKGRENIRPNEINWFCESILVLILAAWIKILPRDGKCSWLAGCLYTQWSTYFLLLYFPSFKTSHNWWRHWSLQSSWFPWWVSVFPCFTRSFGIGSRSKLQLNPMRRNQLSGSLHVVFPFFGRYGGALFFGQKSTPPTEAGVSNNVVFAQRHQLHVFVWIRSTVVINELTGVFGQIFFAPI